MAIQSDGSIDSTDQLDTMTQMSNRSTVQRLGYSSPGSYSPSVVADNANDNYPGIDYTGYQEDVGSLQISGVDFSGTVTAG